jgi:hypothetical protein
MNRDSTGDKSNPPNVVSRLIVTFHDSPDPKIGPGDPGDPDVSCDAGADGIPANPNHLALRKLNQHLTG